MLGSPALLIERCFVKRFHVVVWFSFLAAGCSQDARLSDGQIPTPNESKEHHLPDVVRPVPEVLQTESTETGLSAAGQAEYETRENQLAEPSAEGWKESIQRYLVDRTDVAARTARVGVIILGSSESIPPETLVQIIQAKFTPFGNGPQRPFQNLRRAAIRALAHIDRNHPVLTETASNPIENFRVRGASLAELAADPTLKHNDLISHILRDPNEHFVMRMRAAFLLINQKKTPSLDLVLNYIQAESVDEVGRSVAAFALGFCGDSRCDRSLLRTVADRSVPTVVRCFAAYSYHRRPMNETTFELLSKILVDESESIDLREQIALSFLHSRTPLALPILNLMKGRNDRVGAAARGEVFSEWRSKNSEGSNDGVASLSETERAQLRNEMLLTLNNSNNNSDATTAVSVLVKAGLIRPADGPLLLDSKYAGWMASVTDDGLNSTVENPMIDALVVAEQSAKPKLIELLASLRGPRLSLAVDTLLKMGSLPTIAETKLRALIIEPQLPWYQRRAVIQLVEKLEGFPSQDTLRLLRDRLDDEDPGVAILALRALVDFKQLTVEEGANQGFRIAKAALARDPKELDYSDEVLQATQFTTHDQSVELLNSLAKTGSLRGRVKAVRQLNSLGGLREELFHQVRTAFDEYVRDSKGPTAGLTDAIDVLKTDIFPLSRLGAAQIVRRLRDKSWEETESALTGITVSSDNASILSDLILRHPSEALPYLKRLLAYDEHEFHQAPKVLLAICALSKMENPPRIVSVPRLEGLLERGYESNGIYTEALGPVYALLKKYGLDPLASLVRAFRDPMNLYERTEAMSFLGTLGREASSIAVDIRALLEKYQPNVDRNQLEIEWLLAASSAKTLSKVDPKMFAEEFPALERKLLEDDHVDNFLSYFDEKIPYLPLAMIYWDIEDEKAHPQSLSSYGILNLHLREYLKSRNYENQDRLNQSLRDCYLLGYRVPMDLAADYEDYAKWIHSNDFFEIRAYTYFLAERGLTNALYAWFLKHPTEEVALLLFQSGDAGRFLCLRALQSGNKDLMLPMIRGMRAGHPKPELFYKYIRDSNPNVRASALYAILRYVTLKN